VGGTSFPFYLDWAARNHTFEGIAAVDPSSRLVSRPNGSGGEVITSTGSRGIILISWARNLCAAVTLPPMKIRQDTT